MALRQLRLNGDEILTKKSKTVRSVDLRTLDLIDDMFDTMYENAGCGLAAVQVGVLKRIFVVDITGDAPMVFINPEIVERKGEQTGDEGCLSVPNKIGCVIRPNYIRIKAFDEEMKGFELIAEGFLARAICHEYDHLDGIIYTSKVQGELREAKADSDEELEQDE